MSLKSILLYIIYVAAIVVLTVAIITSFDQSSTKPKPKAPSGGISQAPAKPAAPKQPSTSEGKPTPSSSSSPSSSPAHPAEGPSQSISKPGQLTNTGPGDLVAVFIGSSLLGMLGYRSYLRRQLA